MTYQKLFDKAKSIIKENECIKFFDETKPLYLETMASGVGLGASLQPQTRSGTSYPRDMAPDSSMLSPIAFALKSLLREEKRFSKIERGALGMLHSLKKVPSLLLYKTGEYNHRLLVPIFKKRCANNILKTTANSPQNTPTQSQNNIQI